MKNYCNLLFLVMTFSVFGQFSKTHYIPPLSNSDSQAPQGQYMYISCPSLTPINFKIQQIGGTSITGIVSRDNPYMYTIGTGFNTQLLIPKSNVNAVMSNKGYIVEAEDLVYVTVRLTSTPENYQAGGLVSKGIAALGTQFRIGAFINTGAPAITDNHYTFATILATENNTTVSFGDIKIGGVLINEPSLTNTHPDILLNAGQSYAIAVEGPTDANRDALIGASITSNKPIAVNCGSFAGTDGTTTNLDLGFDQIVSAERTGTKYIFVKGNGVDVTERPLIIANEDFTDVFLNGSATADITLMAGQYKAYDGANYSSNGNLYINTSKKVFAYQGIGGTSSQANQNMCFLPPLSCQTPKVINNIPLINEVGSGLTNFIGTVCIVTETNAILTFIINRNSYTLLNLPSGISFNGPLNVIGNQQYVTYTFNGLTGNISVFSTKQLYLSYFGSSGAATYGGYYSGFTFKPEISFQSTNTTVQTKCIPDVELTVNSLSSFDNFQWYFNGVQIATNGNNSSYHPLVPGNYYVSATISSCGSTLPELISDIIPVSNCPPDSDNDLSNDNIDIDSDNDGITNCTESYGTYPINLSNLSGGNLRVNSYSNFYSASVTTSVTASATPFTGSADGSFVSVVPPGKGNFVTYTLNNFTQPMSIGIEYITTGNSANLLNSNAEYSISSPINKTITVLNPNNQLLIDTNYDGVYESGVTQYSSFEIRFRLNSTIPLLPGTGQFKFLTNLTDSILFTHKNLLDTSENRSTLKIIATCVPKDSDNDGIPDQLDPDSDGDGIPDAIEAQGQNFVPLSYIDANGNGYDDAFELLNPALLNTDSDGDGIPDYLDLDSDNDGIYDAVETGSLATDTDGDGIKNFRDLDSDGDECNDVKEAGFIDGNNDGILGNATPVVNAKGVVTNASSGYTTPNPNYILAEPITPIGAILPVIDAICDLQTTTAKVLTNADTFQWQVQLSGIWTTITNNATYSGSTTNSLQIQATYAMNNLEYRVILGKNNNICGKTSSSAVLTVYDLPVINTPIQLKQCDVDTDGITDINLTQQESRITNSVNKIFTYYTDATAAETGNQNSSYFIANPIQFRSGTTTVWVRVTDTSHGCFKIAELNIIVTATQIPTTFQNPFYKCDDFLDTNGNNNANNNNRDGIASFDFSIVTNRLHTNYPVTNTYSIAYYKNEQDANAETDAQGNSLALSQNPLVANNITNYRNIGSPNQQQIYVRIENPLDNSCFGLGNFISLTVEALPIAYSVNAANTIRHCDDDQDGVFRFDTSALENTILGGQTNVRIQYFNASGASYVNLPNPFLVNGTESITVRVTNNTTQVASGPCYIEEIISFVVDVAPQVRNIDPTLLAICDDEANPLLQDGFNYFNTATIQATILSGQPLMNVTYTDGNGQTLPTPFPATFNSNTQIVTALVQNPLNATCPVSIPIPFVVHPLPQIELNLDGAISEIVCVNLPGYKVKLDAGLVGGIPSATYTYQWFLNGIALPGATATFIKVNIDGMYSVVVTTAFGCSRTRFINVTSSVIATIQDIKVIDLTDSNSVEIQATGAGGDYVYALDYPSNFQSSPFFTSVLPGIHEVYVKDLNGCGTLGPVEISVLGVPSFFTPNADGYNDTWNVKGINNTFNRHAEIRVYDRFGKFIIQVNPTGSGWDGTLNGIPLTADDYWFNIRFEDNRIAKGHFSLKR